jgi:ubiquinone biosynthesis protein UbiJ
MKMLKKKKVIKDQTISLRIEKKVITILRKAKVDVSETVRVYLGKLALEVTMESMNKIEKEYKNEK